MSYPDGPYDNWTYKELYEDVKGSLIYPGVLEELISRVQVATRAEVEAEQATAQAATWRAERAFLRQQHALRFQNGQHDG